VRGTAVKVSCRLFGNLGKAPGKATAVPLTPDPSPFERGEIRALMPEMPYPREHHGEALFVGGGDHFVVAH
jgi:hypothetical protein